MSNIKTELGDKTVWYKHLPGAALLETELVNLNKVLPKMCGYYAVQIGGQTDNTDILSQSPIHNHIIVNPDISLKHNNRSLAVKCELEELPFLEESIDLFALIHALEFAKKPELVLKEIYRSLLPGGYLTILGFNPYSLWGIVKFWKNSRKNIWGKNWIRLKLLRNWLIEIGFKIDSCETFYFRPPCANANTKKMTFLETLGKFFWPHCGASYMVVAQKASLLLTPINHPNYFIKRVEPIKGLPKPTSRVT